MKRIKAWYWTVAIGALLCGLWLVNVGDASHRGIMAGLSLNRLLMVGVLGLFFIVGICGALGVWAPLSPWMGKRGAKGAFAGLAWLAWTGYTVLGFMAPERFLPFFERLRPLLVFFFLIGLSGWVCVASVTGSRNSSFFREQGLLGRLFLLCFGVGIGLYLTVRLTGVGIVPDEMDWQPTGMTVQYWQIAASLSVALLCAWIGGKLRPRVGARGVELISFFLIWGLTAWLWVSIPTMEVLNHSYFMEITAPNYLPYPASDAANFGVWVESILAGLGFKSAIAYRQFLITVLALFQTLTGGDLLRTIDCLTVLLALIPACMYLLGSRLHSDGAGWLAAGLAAAREYNTILLGPHYMVSSAKMWLSDLPALLCLLASITAAVSWYRKPRSWIRLVLSGCLMGLCVTVRSQFIVLTVFPALIFLFTKGLSLRTKLTRAVVFLAAVFLVIAPWFIRSKMITGQFILDDPGVHSTELARRYSDDVTNRVERMEGESDADYAARNQAHMAAFFREKPLYVVQFVMSHFFANEIYSLCALPFGTDPALTLGDVTNTDFHDVETRLLAPRNIPVLTAFLALIALGLAAAIRRCGWAGFLPFLMCSLYLGSTSVARYSGWRFALPGDWHFYFYFALGLCELLGLIGTFLSGKDNAGITVPPFDPSPRPLYSAGLAGLLILFLICGMAPAVLQLLPDRVTQFSSDENLERVRVLTEDYPDLAERLAPVLEVSGIEAVNGRDLYPRFFYADHGLASGHPWPSYVARDYPRLGMVLLNHENVNVVLPMDEEPGFVPHGRDVIVLGQHTAENIFRGLAMIFLPDDSGSVPWVLMGTME